MNLWIIGAGGHAKIVADSLADDTTYEKIFFYDAYKLSDMSIHFPKSTFVTSDPPEIQENNTESFIAIGESNIRSKIANKFSSHSFAKLINSASTISSGSEILSGSYIGAGAVININSLILEHSIVNTNAVVEHDCRVGNFSHIGPGAIICGGVKLGNGVFIGANSCVNPGIEIVDHVTIGSGSVVSKDISEPGVYAGVPVKKISQ
jgi:acetyltransferase EpsM